jgi:diadenosine tetraphosphate (Ap4A) HIT family hydrolase
MRDSATCRWVAQRLVDVLTKGVGILECVFCDRLVAADVVAANDLAVAFPDAFPLNRGHCLIVPRRHEADFLALTWNEQAAIWALLPMVRHHIEASGVPDGYNIGINVGTAAGQTVAHAHVHFIPRYHADVRDPRGGIRWIIPSKAQYWKSR